MHWEVLSDRPPSHLASLPPPQAPDSTGFWCTLGVVTSKLASVCLLVHLWVSHLFSISDSVVWTVLHVLPEHFCTWEFPSHNPETTTMNVCVSLQALQCICYTLKQTNKQKNPTNKLLQTSSYNLPFSLAIENALCFSVICNVCLVFSWVAVLEFFLTYPPVTGSTGVL